MSGEEDEIVDVDDLGDDLRVAALHAWRVPQEAMTPVAEFTDLPIAAALAGPSDARRMFAPEADAYRYARDNEKPLLYAERARAGIDLVRGLAATQAGRIAMVDAACFTVFTAPADAPLPGAILNLAAPVAFSAPDADGWRSTAPDLPVQAMDDWTDRIDMREGGRERLYLLYKTYPGSTVFTPTLEWF